MKNSFLFIFCILLLTTVHNLSAQRYEKESFPRRKNVLSGELMGSGGIVSLNYSRVIGSWRNLFIDGKVGLGSDGIPLNFSMNVGGGQHYFYAGLTGKLSYWDIDYNDQTPEPQLNAYPVFGYKLHPVDSRFYMNIYYMTYTYERQRSQFGGVNPKDRMHWIGVGVGYAFK